MFAQIFWALAAFAACVQATGDFVLLHTPDSVIFKGNKEIDQSLLKEVFSASLGFTVKQRATWNGLLITTPYYLPEAGVIVPVEGVDSLGAIKGHKYPMVVDEFEETTWQGISGRLEERDSDNCLVRIYLGDGLDALGQSALGELKPTSIDESSLKALSLKNDEDRKFLEEVQLLHAIAKKVPSAVKADGKADLYWLVVSGLRPVYDLHGKNSPAAKEALTLLNEALHALSKSFIEVYKNQVLIAAFTNDASQVRHTRSIHVREERDANEKKNNTETTMNKVETSSSTPKRVPEEEEKEKSTEKSDSENEKHTEDGDEDKIHENSDKIDDHTNTDTQTTSLDESDQNEHSNGIKNKDKSLEVYPNLAKEYEEDYPVVFNIILWFGVAFFFSLLAICIFIAEMDPGRDSIIYRMTSNRMKKDN